MPQAFFASAVRHVIVGVAAAVFLAVTLSLAAGPAMAATTGHQAGNHKARGHKASEGDAGEHKIARHATRRHAAASQRSRRTHAAAHRRPHHANAIASRDNDEPVSPKARRHVRVASLGNGEEFVKPRKSLSGGNLSWNASSGCLAGSLREVLAEASALATIRVNSTCRSRSHNRAVGGAGHSYHLSGEAADFHVYGNVGRVYAFLRGNGAVGGLKHYGGGVFHIDTGPRRSW